MTSRGSPIENHPLTKVWNDRNLRPVKGHTLHLLDEIVSAFGRAIADLDSVPSDNFVSPVSECPTERVDFEWPSGVVH